MWQKMDHLIISIAGPSYSSYQFKPITSVILMIACRTHAVRCPRPKATYNGIVNTIAGKRFAPRDKGSTANNPDHKSCPWVDLVR
jgi:hypothetical protein